MRSTPNGCYVSLDEISIPDSINRQQRGALSNPSTLALGGIHHYPAPFLAQFFPPLLLDLLLQFMVDVREKADDRQGNAEELEHRHPRSEQHRSHDDGEYPAYTIQGCMMDDRYSRKDKCAGEVVRCEGDAINER
mmetsp:Transcript_25211/g.40982  ORF Transcript_25211/g.40982 Transcript_25211/m.40982 type:complete len:135 (-) Transcript_25211:89-493(-)